MKEEKENEYEFVSVFPITAPNGQSGMKREVKIVKESDLTRPQKDLLMGELIKTWNNTPKEAQHKFITDLFKREPTPERIRMYKDKIEEEFLDEVQRQIDEDNENSNTK